MTRRGCQCNMIPCTCGSVHAVKRRMTSDEAKARLESMRVVARTGGAYKGTLEAIDMALQAIADKEWFEERERYLRGHAGISGDYRQWLDAWDKDHPRPAP